MEQGWVFNIKNSSFQYTVYCTNNTLSYNINVSALEPLPVTDKGDATDYGLCTRCISTKTRYIPCMASPPAVTGARGLYLCRDSDIFGTVFYWRLTHSRGLCNKSYYFWDHILGSLLFNKSPLLQGGHKTFLKLINAKLVHQRLNIFFNIITPPKVTMWCCYINLICQ